MTYAELPGVLHSLICLWGLLLFWGFAALTLVRSSNKGLLPLTLAGLLLSFGLLHGTADIIWPYSATDRDAHVMAGFPAFCPPLLALLLTLGGLALLGVVINRDRAQLTNQSVKAGVDAMPDGICWYSREGILVLKNQAMEDLCLMLTGAALLNGRSFEMAIEANTGADGLVHLTDGSVWRVTRREAKRGGRPLFELTAAEVTEEYRVTEQLMAEQTQLEQVNHRLSDYMKELMHSITAREILAAKMKIHDDLGLLLLSSRRYISQGGSEDEKQLLRERFRSTMALLREEKSPVERQDEYSLVLNAASHVKVDVQISGTLPEQEPWKHVAASALHECITNTLRHAKGNQIQVCAEARGRKRSISFTNNGTQPKGPIEPGGGLRSLKRLAEEANMTMALESFPAFCLTLSYEVNL